MERRSVVTTKEKDDEGLFDGKIGKVLERTVWGMQMVLLENEE
jgi:hypothetical protein